MGIWLNGKKLMGGYIADGIAAAPGLSLVGDPNSGLYGVGEDNIGLITGGVAGQGIYISSTGKVGVGATTTPDSPLHVWASSAGAVTAIGNTVLTIERGGQCFVSILSPAASDAAIMWGCPTNNIYAVIDGFYNAGAPYLTLGIGGERLRVMAAGIGVGTASRTGLLTPQALLDVFGGDVLIADPTDLGTESLSETDFATHAKWDVTGDFLDTGGNAAYTHSSGVGTLTQTSGNLAVAGVGSRWYKFQYTVSGVTAGCAATITTAFASSAQTLVLTNGTQTLYFKSAASPANFVISATSSAGGFTLDDLTLKEVQGGDVAVHGLLTGGGTSGVKVLANGRVGMGVTAPLAKLHIDQASSSGAVPVLILDQGDVSEEFERYIGTSAADNSQSLVDAADLTTPGAIVGWRKVYVQDDAGAGDITDGVYYIPFYATPTA